MFSVSLVQRAFVLLQQHTGCGEENERRLRVSLEVRSLPSSKSDRRAPLIKCEGSGVAVAAQFDIEIIYWLSDLPCHKQNLVHYFMNDKHLQDVFSLVFVSAVLPVLEYNC